MDTFEAVRDSVELVLDGLRRWSVDRPTFDQVKSLRPIDRFEAAARFIYLNKTCWNGLFRVNASGEFNVPYGRPKSDRVIDPDNLRACAALLAGDVELAQRDFEVAVASAGPGDLVYFDPPYVTGHNDNGFIDYNEVLFSWADQERLASVAHELNERDVWVVVSNADHQPVVDLFDSFEMIRVSRHSTIAGRTASRRTTSEVVLYNTRRGSTAPTRS